MKLNYYLDGQDESSKTTLVLSNCNSGKKQECSVSVNLAEYNGKKIKYWFTAEDYAGNIKNSAVRKILVQV